jgi:hypothetical protein
MFEFRMVSVILCFIAIDLFHVINKEMIYIFEIKMRSWLIAKVFLYM